MELKFDKRGNPRIEFSPDELKDQKRAHKQNIIEANAVKEMMGSNGWKVLTRHLKNGENAILKAAMDGLALKSKVELTQIKVAILKGFTEAEAFPDRIVDIGKQSEDTLKELKEEQNDEPSGNDYGE